MVKLDTLHAGMNDASTASMKGGLVLERIGNAVSADQAIIFGSEGKPIWLGRGWAQREASFCWTIGPFAEIVLDFQGDAGLISIDCAPLILGSRDRTQVLLFTDGVLVCAEVLRERQVIAFPISAGKRKISLLIWIPDAVAPSALDTTIADDRQLGLQVFSIAFTPDTDQESDSA